MGGVITDDIGGGTSNGTRVFVLSNTALRESPGYVKWYILIGSGFVMLFVPIAVMFFSCVSIRSGGNLHMMTSATFSGFHVPFTPPLGVDVRGCAQWKPLICVKAFKSVFKTIGS